jgi:hypothetical protein
MREELKQEYKERAKAKYQMDNPDEYDEDDAWGDVRKAKQAIEKYEHDVIESNSSP